VNNIFVGTHVKKINGVNDGGVIGITNNMQCNNNLSEAMQRAWENQHWGPMSSRIRAKACEYENEVKI
jgi:hypothetical protein